ncbi:MAG TPA: helix-turn-helix domain-containing protein [Kiritimatiellia bacterium]|nr:helix-turn-helix domain-containing protein [Kiritimatiellia bacterium]HNS79947.1 helix-turn-helix domain-containing protein [Kiritimatiellia bacterium]
MVLMPEQFEEKARPVRKNRAQLRAVRTHNKLLNAALMMFSEKGMDATTVEDITERADLGKGTFYRHFSTKEELMSALVQKAVDGLIEEMHKSAAGAGNLKTLLGKLLEAHKNFFNTRREEFILLFQGRVMLKLQRGMEEDFEQPFVLYLGELENMLAPFVPGSLSPIKLKRLACALAGFVSGFLSFAMIGLGANEIDSNMMPMGTIFIEGASAFLSETEKNADADQTAKA